MAYCGSNFVQTGAGTSAVQYQGNNATHSSISIGSVTRDPTTNTLKANTANNSTGVGVRGTGTAVPVNLGPVARDGVLIKH